MPEFELVPHPGAAPRAIDAIKVHLQTDFRRTLIHYFVMGDPPLIPPDTGSVRTDGLWQRTCFELFMALDDRAYVEFNFSPSGAWAAYTFRGYRKSQRNMPMNVPPKIKPVESGTRVLFDTPAQITAGRPIALSAVIEETDGTKSYWALAHAPGPPDFHNPACFTATLPAPGEG